MYRFLNRAILAVFFMSIITACGEGDTGIIPIDPSDDSTIQLETEAEVTSDKDDTDDSSGSDSGVSNTSSGDSGSKTVSSGQGFKSNGNAALEVSGSSISRGGDVKPPPTVPPTVPPIVPPTEPENPACTLAICDNKAGVEDLPNYHPTPSIAGKSTFLTIETGKDINTTGTGRLVNEQLVAIGSDDILRWSHPGDARDGWQAFSGKLASDPQGDNVYFAGLLPTTDLGRPLSTAPTTTTWPGTFTFGGFENHAIDFKIDFANRQIDARTIVEDSDFSTSFALGFSEGGSVNGTVLRYSTHESQFTSDGTYLLLGHYRAMGLIGQQGLVGALVNIKGYIEDAPFGGFSADNPTPEPAVTASYACPLALCDNKVSAADLPNYPTSANPAGGSGFLTILPSDIAEQPAMIDTTGVIPATDTLLIIKDSRAGDENDGWQAFYGKLASDPQGDNVYFAGILPTTDLGPPLIEAPAITTWPGTFNFAGEEGSVNFEIDFASRTIDGQGITQSEIDSTAKRQQKHITDSIAQDSNLTESDITPLIIPRREFIRFSLGFSETGTVFGSILRNSNPEGQDPFYGDNISVRGNYQATGLIGQEGLVGAALMSKDGFIANAPYGGFVADNPNNQ